MKEHNRTENKRKGKKKDITTNWHARNGFGPGSWPCGVEVPTDKKPLRPASPSIDTQALSTSLISLSFFPFTSVLFFSHSCALRLLCLFCSLSPCHITTFLLTGTRPRKPDPSTPESAVYWCNLYRFLIISLSQRAWATKSQSKALSPSFLAHAILRSAQEAEVEQEAGKV